MSSKAFIANNLHSIRQSIHEAAQKAGRHSDEITLVAVSKTHDATAVRSALLAGQRVFGENRVQEAMQKYPDLRRDFPDLELHLIGPLQTNKAEDAVRLFDVIETLDRPKLAAVLAKEMKKQNRFLKCFVQVNTGEEPQKAGIVPREADTFIADCQNAHGLNVEGVMCIPPLDADPAPHFALLKDIAHRNKLPFCSMGMSGDFTLAIQFGATHVRVGTAIFGVRDYT